MGTKTATLFHRLKSDGDDLGFDYMGAAEYEFGTSHNALDVLVNDIGHDHLVTETGIVLSEEDAPLWASSPVDKKSYGWRRMSKRERDAEIERRDEVTSVLDGSALLFRHIPGVSEEDDVRTIVSARNLGAFRNKGTLWTSDTRAWMTIFPVVGFLYHPKNEHLVNSFVERIRALRAEKNPDADERAEEALRRAIKDDKCGVRSDARIGSFETLPNP